MTTPAPHDPAIRYGDRIQTRRASSSAHPAAQDWSQWEAWMEGHKKLLGEEVVEAIAQHLTDPLDKRIRALETELALANGKLAILSGRGLPGCLNVKGTFDSNTVYVSHDVVARGGSTWVAIKDAPGPCPGPGWQLVASQGKRGVRGEKGERGPAGPAPVLTGARFCHRGMELVSNSGPIPLFKSVAVNAQDFSLRFVAADDSTLTISLLPLFKAYNEQTTST